MKSNQTVMFDKDGNILVRCKYNNSTKKGNLVNCNLEDCSIFPASKFFNSLCHVFFKQNIPFSGNKFKVDWITFITKRQHLILVEKK